MISAEMLKERGNGIIHGLPAVMSAVQQSDAIPPDWSWLSQSRKGKGTDRTTTITMALHCSVYQAKHRSSAADVNSISSASFRSLSSQGSHLVSRQWTRS